MWQKGSKSFVASVDFAHRTSFSNSYISNIFQMLVITVLFISDNVFIAFRVHQITSYPFVYSFCF